MREGEQWEEKEDEYSEIRLKHVKIGGEKRG